MCIWAVHWRRGEAAVQQILMTGLEERVPKEVQRLVNLLQVGLKSDDENSISAYCSLFSATCSQTLPQTTHSSCCFACFTSLYCLCCCLVAGTLAHVCTDSLWISCMDPQLPCSRSYCPACAAICLQGHLHTPGLFTHSASACCSSLQPGRAHSTQQQLLCQSHIPVLLPLLLLACRHIYTHQASSHIAPVPAAAHYNRAVRPTAHSSCSSCWQQQHQSAGLWTPAVAFQSMALRIRLLPRCCCCCSSCLTASCLLMSVRCLCIACHLCLRQCCQMRCQLLNGLRCGICWCCGDERWRRMWQLAMGSLRLVWQECWRSMCLGTLQQQVRAAH
jgi:hypothetical protein